MAIFYPIPPLPPQPKAAVVAATSPPPASQPLIPPRAQVPGAVAVTWIPQPYAIQRLGPGVVTAAFPPPATQPLIPPRSQVPGAVLVSWIPQPYAIQTLEAAELAAAFPPPVAPVLVLTPPRVLFGALQPFPAVLTLLGSPAVPATSPASIVLTLPQNPGWDTFVAQPPDSRLPQRLGLAADLFPAPPVTPPTILQTPYNATLRAVLAAYEAKALYRVPGRPAKVPTIGTLPSLVLPSATNPNRTAVILRSWVPWYPPANRQPSFLDTAAVPTDEGTGLAALLVPFSKPVQPWDNNAGPGQVRGGLNQLVKALNTHATDETIHVVVTTVSGVSGASVARLYPASGVTLTAQALAVVAGDDGAGNAFLDLIAWHPAGVIPSPLFLTTTAGVPVNRAYTLVSGALGLQLGGGVYTITVIPFQF